MARPKRLADDRRNTCVSAESVGDYRYEAALHDANRDFSRQRFNKRLLARDRASR